MPAAVGVVFDAGNDAGLDGVLMNVTEEGGEVVHVVDGLAAETLLEEVTAALVLAVVIIDVSVCDALYGLGNSPLPLTDKQMEMVAHEAVGIVGATLGDGCAIVIIDEAHAEEAVQKKAVVLLILEDHLMVDATHHHMVDSGGGGVSGFSRHGLRFRFQFGSREITEK